MLGEGFPHNACLCWVKPSPTPQQCAKLLLGECYCLSYKPMHVLDMQQAMPVMWHLVQCLWGMALASGGCCPG